MSFGFSIGDFIAVGKLAQAVYRSCRDAPESFSNISMEVLSLHAVLTEVEEIVSAADMSPTRQNGLVVIMRGCEGVLKDLQALVLKYESLGSQSKKTWDRMKWGMNDIAELRSRLTSNTVLLTAFMSTCQVVVERKLNKLAREFQEGKHEGSVITTVTVASLNQSDQETWREIRKEFEDIGISVAAFDANRPFILEWFRSAMASGAFTESCGPAKPDDFDSDIYPLEPNEYLHEDDDSDGESSLPAARGPSGIAVDPVAEVKLQPPEVADGKQDVTRLFFPNQNLRIANQTINPVLKKTPRIKSVLKWALGYDGDFRKAIEGGYLISANSYLSRGVNVDAEVFENEMTALFWAVQYRKLVTSRWLLAKGADPNHSMTPEHGKNTMLCTALFDGQQPNFKMAQLLLENGADINQSRFHSITSSVYVVRTAFYIATKNQNQEIFQWLLARGADFKTQQFGKDENKPFFSRYPALTESPFHAAARNDDKSMLQVLLDNGEDIDVTNGSKMTALHLACSGKEDGMPLAIWLLDRGAKVDSKDASQKTPLFSAAWENKISLAKLLLRRGADVNTRSGDISLFRHLLSNGYDDMGWLFMKWGVDRNEVDKQGNTLLHAAAQGECYNSVVSLLNRGSEVEVENYEGMTPWHVARDWGIKSYLESWSRVLAERMASLRERPS